MVMCPYDVDKQLKILKDFFFSSMNMLVNIDRTNFMIMKSKKTTYTSFMYDKQKLEGSDCIQNILELISIRSLLGLIILKKG